MGGWRGQIFIWILMKCQLVMFIAYNIADVSIQNNLCFLQQYMHARRISHLNIAFVMLIMSMSVQVYEANLGRDKLSLEKKNRKVKYKHTTAALEIFSSPAAFECHAPFRIFISFIYNMPNLLQRCLKVTYLL